MKPGRNEACHCGSNLKYKNCCEKKTGAAAQRNIAPIVIGLFAVAAGAAIIFRPADDARQKTTAAASSSPASPLSERAETPAPAAVPGRVAAGAAGATSVAQTAQPNSGVAPEGQVWSKEHGHYHDKTPESPVKIEMANPQGSGALQAAGAPAAGGAGQVWSEEHKHFHKSQGATPQVAAARAAAARRPAAGVPTTGQVWSEEHKHWHSAPAGTPGAVPMVYPPITTTNP